VNSALDTEAIRSLERRSPLRRVALCALLAAFTVLVGAQFWVGRALYTEGFAQAEQRDQLARVRHAQAVVDQAASQLISTAVDYAVWEDTHAFVTGKDLDYAAINWYAGTFQRLNLTAVVILNEDGRPALATRLDPDNQVRRLGAVELDVLAPGSMRAALGASREPTHGFVSVGGTLWMWGAAGVEPTSGLLPRAGHLLVFRALDDAFVARHSRLLDAQLSIRTTAAGRQPLAGPAELNDVRFVDAEGGMLRSSVAVGRAVGGETVELSLVAPRPMRAVVRAQSWYFLLSSVLGAALIAAVVAWFLSRRVLNPLTSLAQELRAIGRDGAGLQRVSPRVRNDEIAEVIDAVNRMLADIESKRDAESARDAALEASRLKSEFLATMSHEIRTPMNGVLGMLELLVGTELSPEQRHRVETAHQSAANLLLLLNEILDLARLESGRMTLEVSSTDVRAVATQVADLMRARAEAKGLMLDWHVDDTVNAAYRTDGSRLRQVLLNLVGNAIKFTEHGNVSVHVMSYRVDETVDRVAFTVADTGIGIAPTALHTIFEPFTQENSSTTRRFGGSGLGLAICRRLAALMGGTVVARSEVGKGSVFTLELELERCEVVRDVAAPEVPTDALRLHVMVAEDNGVNQLVVGAMLDKLGCTYEIVADGADAVAAYSANPRAFAAILMDVNMPTMDGYEAAERIRAFDASRGAAKRVSIIALTANAMNGDRERCLAAGMDDHLAKPFALAGLRAVLGRAYESSKVIEFPRVGRAAYGA
jgi:signal transduction histidine kinase/CheY-like chemotaxis protein